MSASKTIAGLALVALTFTACTSQTRAQPSKPAAKSDTIPGHVVVKREGFKLIFSQEAWDHKDDPAFKKPPLEVVEGELKTITTLFPTKTLDLLRRLPIWLQWNESLAVEARGGKAVAYYDPAPEALVVKRGQHPLKARTITVNRLKALTMEHQPDRDSGRCVILHEIAHAVHDQILGSQNQVVLAAFKQAVDRKLVNKQVYASTSDHEFFAEMSCAYFDQLDYFPHKRSELLQHDPVTFKIMEETWGKQKPKIVKTESVAIEAPPLSGLQWGRPISGPVANAKTAQGRPTFVMYWQGRDSGSMVALPKVASWEGDLRDFGLVATGVHLTGKSPMNVASLVRDVTFSISEDRWGPESLIDSLKKFPLSLVYDHYGACVFRGSPFEAEKAARSAVGAYLLDKAKVVPPPKDLETIVADLRKGKSPALVVYRLEALAKAKDDETAKAATRLRHVILESAQTSLEEASAEVKDSPVDAYQRLERLANVYKETSVGTAALAQTSKLKQNKQVADEIAARPALAVVKKMDIALSGRPGAFDPAQKVFRSENAEALMLLEKAVQQVRRAHPNTQAAEQAQRIAARYGIGS